MTPADTISDGILPPGAPPGGNSPDRENTAFSNDVVLEALQRIKTSTGFDAPDRSRRLLEYIVKEVLDGRGNRIKAYSIATEVLERPSSFDPQKDPIVRIEAARLRRALEHYYLTDGLNDPVVIDIPKGGYVATFKVREPKPAAEGSKGVSHGGAGRNRVVAAFVILTVMTALYLAFDFHGWRRSEQAAPDQRLVHLLPGVVIKPLVDLTKADGSDILVQGLTERIIERTSRFRDLTVIASDGTTAKPRIETARYEFGGMVRVVDENLLVQTRLVDRTDGRVLWADTLESSLKAGRLFSVEAEISNQIAAKIGEPNGIIFKTDRKSAIETPPENWDAYLCMLHAYAYRATFAAKEHAEVRSCLESAVSSYPDFATAWALLSLTYVDEVRFQLPGSQEDGGVLTRAYQAANRAIDLDPTNIRGQQALMMTLFFRKEYDAAIAVGKNALSLNPNDMEFKGDYGFRLALSGNWEEGCKLVREALDSSGRKIGYHKIALSLCQYFKNDIKSAADLIVEASAIDNANYHIIAATILAEAGRTGEADESRRWLQQNASGQLPTLLPELPRRLIRPEDRARFAESMRKAGFDLP